MSFTLTPDLQLGLIGDNIARSRSPLLHRLAGEQNGMHVAYDWLIPKDMGQDFNAVFGGCAASGFRGINVTYPYKEIAARKVQVEDPLVRAIGAVNAVIFEGSTAKGHNTDYSGFVAAYQGLRDAQVPGDVLMIGTGGVGRAVAFGLVKLGATEIRLMDRDRAKAEGLAAELRQVARDIQVSVHENLAASVDGVIGVINCTPVGMVGRSALKFSLTSFVVVAPRVWRETGIGRWSI